MTIEETKDAIRVMQAYVDGKKIEIYGLTKKEWEYIKTPRFNWGTFAYRIAPDQEEPKEKHYHPYTMEEFVEDMHKHDGFVRKRTVNDTYGLLVDGVFSDSISVSGFGFTFEELCNDYVWSDDGQPCGKEVTK